jgi:hypothetical protein
MKKLDIIKYLIEDHMLPEWEESDEFARLQVLNHSFQANTIGDELEFKFVEERYFHTTNFEIIKNVKWQHIVRFFLPNNIEKIEIIKKNRILITLKKKCTHKIYSVTDVQVFVHNLNPQTINLFFNNINSMNEFIKICNSWI